MNEVSGKVLALYEQAEVHLGLAPGSLFTGLPVAPRAAPERIGWEVVCELTRRLSGACGGREALERCGAAIVGMPEITPLVRMVGLASGPRALYWASWRLGGPRLFAHLQDTFVEPEEGVVLLTMTIPPFYTDCPEFFHLVAGLFRALPRVLSLPDASVDLHVSPRCGAFRIALPPTLTLWSRLRGALPVLGAATGAIEHLAEENARLFRQLTEGARAREEAERAQMEAERALRIRSELLATLTHDLRTPLNGVLGMASLLQETELDTEQTQYVDTIVLSGKALLGIINGVLDGSQSQTVAFPRRAVTEKPPTLPSAGVARGRDAA